MPIWSGNRRPAQDFLRALVLWVFMLALIGLARVF